MVVLSSERRYLMAYVELQIFIIYRQCFCGPKPNFSDANKISEKNCNSACVTEP